MLILPDALPAAITAVTLLSETTEKDDASTPPIITASVPVKWLPLMVIVAPTPDDVGENDVITGTCAKVKPARLEEPNRVVTDTLPLEPVATTAVMMLSLTTVKEDAAVPPKVTDDVPVNSEPCMVTVESLPANTGVNEFITGRWVTSTVTGTKGLVHCVE